MLLVKCFIIFRAKIQIYYSDLEKKNQNENFFSTILIFE